MGQKIHPLGFRLGVSQAYYSTWFARPQQYSRMVQEDMYIRGSIQSYVQNNIRSSLKKGGVTRILIRRKTDLIQVNIQTVFPSLFIQGVSTPHEADASMSGLTQLRTQIRESIVLAPPKLQIVLSEVAKPYAEASILAEYVALQLENRVAFRRTMKKAIGLAQEKGQVEGIKIQIAGRLNGAEIARVEWMREGRVPLHTLRAQIDYACYPAQTIYGVLGIKVWLFQSESFARV